jgi:lysozyme
MSSVFDYHRTYSLASTLIAEWEGFRATPYEDSVGVETVGYGFTPHLPYWSAIKDAAPLSKQDADQFLALALEDTYLPALYEMTEQGVVDAPHKAAALASWTYNIGVPSARNSTLIERLNAGDEEEAEAELLRWTYAGGEVLEGLVARREAERRMMERDETGRASRAALSSTAQADAQKIPVAEVKRLPDGADEGTVRLDLPDHVSDPYTLPSSV